MSSIFFWEYFKIVCLLTNSFFPWWFERKCLPFNRWYVYFSRKTTGWTITVVYSKGKAYTWATIINIITVVGICYFYCPAPWNNILTVCYFPHSKSCVPKVELQYFQDSFSDGEQTWNLDFINSKQHKSCSRREEHEAKAPWPGVWTPSRSVARSSWNFPRGLWWAIGSNNNLDCVISPKYCVWRNWFA